MASPVITVRRKKIRQREEEPLDVCGDDVMLEEGRPTVLSFRDAVMNSNSEKVAMKNEWDGDDLKLNKGDVRKCVVDGVPTLDFSDKVYDLIDESMSKTLVIKLLGKKIGYNVMWNKICSL